MSDDTGLPSSSPAGGGRGERVRAWLRAHRTVVFGGGAAAGVVVLALVHRRNAAAAAGGDPSSSDPTSSPAIAGLGANPDTLSSDIGNQVQGQLNDFLDNLPDPTAVTTGPKVPRPLPRPGKGRYTIHKGDTLADVLMAVYGTTAKWAERALKLANPTLATFGLKDKLSHYAGDTLTVPRAHRPHPDPKPPAHHHAGGGNNERRRRRREAPGAPRPGQRP